LFEKLLEEHLEELLRRVIMKNYFSESFLQEILRSNSQFAKNLSYYDVFYIIFQYICKNWMLTFIFNRVKLFVESKGAASDKMQCLLF